jgi:hypothetical protein
VGKHGRDVNNITEESIFLQSQKQSVTALIKVTPSALIAVMANYNRLKCDASARLRVADLRAYFKNFADSLVADDTSGSGDLNRGRTSYIAGVRICGN